MSHQKYTAQNNAYRCTQIMRERTASRCLDKADRNFLSRMRQISPAVQCADVLAKAIGDLHQIMEHEDYHSTPSLKAISKMQLSIHGEMAEAQNQIEEYFRNE